MSIFEKFRFDTSHPLFQKYLYRNFISLGAVQHIIPDVVKNYVLSPGDKRLLLQNGYLDLEPNITLILDTRYGFLEILDKRDPDNWLWNGHINTDEFLYIGKSPLMINTEDRTYQIYKSQKVLTNNSDLFPYETMKKLLPTSIMGQPLESRDGSLLFRLLEVQMPNNVWIKVNEKSGEVLCSANRSTWFPVWREECTFMDIDLPIHLHREYKHDLPKILRQQLEKDKFFFPLFFRPGIDGNNKLNVEIPHKVNASNQITEHKSQIKTKRPGLDLGL
ncbi:hypothetical protein [Chitinophaga rhizophila]|uniref:Uncharacterized protein n=1 Tax=Chitinophaga rhizophila TaxID=2866212 RepID=A0ABS7G9F9_9BACT|nr:hypothetical protein [Chitinophaga rhizophila]MBW8683429.1 hypothetical protein [Chitinophaga rhizophila]